MSIKVNYVKTEEPIETIEVTNAKGYRDLVVNITNNGKAIRIAKIPTKGDGTDLRVHVTLGEVDDLIEALTLVRDSGVPMSTKTVAKAA